MAVAVMEGGGRRWWTTVVVVAATTTSVVKDGGGRWSAVMVVGVAGGGSGRVAVPYFYLKNSKTLQSFIEQVTRLDQIIRKMILESLGVEKYLEEHMKSTYHLARLIKYKGPLTNEAKVGLPAHTDKNILTILCQNQIDGLEVQTKSGEWIKCKPSSSYSFVAITGDSLYAWANGRVHTPLHRVMMTGNETRFSVGLFTIPKPGYIIKTPDELVTEEHPLLFKPFVHSEFMKFLRSSEGVKNALKAYAGV